MAALLLSLGLAPCMAENYHFRGKIFNVNTLSLKQRFRKVIILYCLCCYFFVYLQVMNGLSHKRL